MRVDVVCPGSGEGEVLHLEPVSFWGGVDPETGRIIDVSHPQHGQSMAGRMVVMPHGKGSSGGSNILAELIRGNMAPAGLVLRANDCILLTGAIVANQLYAKTCPIVIAEDSSTMHGRWRIEGEHLTEV